MVKRNSIKFAALLLILILGLTACGKNEEISDTNNGTSSSTDQQTDSKDGEGDLVGKTSPYHFVSANGEFSLDLPDVFVETETEEVLKDESGGTQGQIYRFEADGTFLEVSDLLYPEIEVNEELIQEEVVGGEGLLIKEIKTIDTKDNHLFVGAEVMDTSMGSIMHYYRTKVGDRIISIVLISSADSDYSWSKTTETMLSSFVVSK